MNNTITFTTGYIHVYWRKVLLQQTIGKYNNYHAESSCVLYCIFYGFMNVISLKHNYSPRGECI